MKKELFYITCVDGIKTRLGYKKVFTFNDDKFVVFLDNENGYWCATEEQSGLSITFGNKTMKSTIDVVNERLEQVSYLVKNNKDILFRIEKLKEYKNERNNQSN